jgi:hypothetical protein
MRFEARIRLWQRHGAALLMALWAFAMIRAVMRHGVRADAWNIVLLPLTSSGTLVFMFRRYILRQYADIREDGLQLRRGWKTFTLPWQTIAEVRSENARRETLIVAGSSRLLITTPANEDRFLAEIANRCPQLKKTPVGLQVPFALLC